MKSSTTCFSNSFSIVARKHERQLMVAQAIGMRQHERRLEPLVDRQDRRPFPFQHRFEKLVFAAGRHDGRVDAVDRLVEQRLELVAQLRVAEQVLDIFRLR